MRITPLRVRLLSPMFNYCTVTKGGALTSDFIGDIALTYALNRLLKDQNGNGSPLIVGQHGEFRRKPVYEELNKLPYFFTVARPLRMERTPIYRRYTSFQSDNFFDAEGIFKIRGQNPKYGSFVYKYSFLVQGISPESEFSTCLLSANSFVLPHLPFAVRLGTGRECLALLEQEKSFDDEVWLNAFALKTIFRNLPQAVRILDKSYFFTYKLENYILMKRITIAQTQKIFEDIFDG